ncbi:MAG: bifunctional 4-hydroxy-2-oxoglutarate aldolase/2-dehydro-3-deoxy-phosphogluconate aldolase [Trueperaceae bacterium]|nr:bifunctional 4-hydroxy-2-oxoglutarate aldolase/2-dehydro-3-deoxy-phosphogluconate aldolase [Trueperaceae bacterium]
MSGLQSPAADSRVSERIREERIIAILRGVPIEHLATLGQALWRGGFRVAEITFTDDDAEDKIALLGKSLGNDALVGAGTVTNAETARRAVEAGARFLVTPHVVDEVSAFGRDNGVHVISGALTPGEIALARSQGNALVKVFPAKMVGPDYIRALRGPYPDAELVAVGGIEEGDVRPFLHAGAVAVGIGGTLTRLDWDAPDFDHVHALATRLVSLVAASRVEST